jgi:hypothetical protein
VWPDCGHPPAAAPPQRIKFYRNLFFVWRNGRVGPRLLQHPKPISIAHLLDQLFARKAPARTFMYVESGEEALGEIASAIAAKLGLGAPRSWSADEAIAAWGRNMAVFSLGSNSRVRGKAAAALGWSPAHRSITRWIVEELT